MMCDGYVTGGPSIKSTNAVPPNSRGEGGPEHTGVQVVHRLGSERTSVPTMLEVESWQSAREHPGGSTE